MIDPLRQMGARIRSKSGNGLAPLEIDGGGLHGMHYPMPIASAQVKSAILLAALQADGETRIVEPQRSRDHTEVMIRGFGGGVNVDGVAYWPQRRAISARPGSAHSRGYLFGGVFSGGGGDDSRLGCDGAQRRLQSDPGWHGRDSARHGRGDRVRNERTEAGERVADIHVTGGPLRGVDVGPELVARTIDEYPILAVAGAVAEGVTRFSDVKELRFKESDRIAAMTEGLAQSWCRKSRSAMTA